MILADETPIELDVLDAHDNALTRLSATLRHLEEEQATVTLPENTSLSCLHWGSRVRFWIGEGVHTYEAIGSIIAHNLPLKSRERDVEEGFAAPREATVHLWTCRPVSQMREMPRRSTRFPVLFRPLPTEGVEEADAASSEEWQQAWCINLSAGGLKLRSDLLSPAPKGLLLRFPLSASRQKEDQSLLLRGRVLRADVCGKEKNSLEMAVKFANLSVEEGLALTHFLAK